MMMMVMTLMMMMIKMSSMTDRHRSFHVANI